MRAGGGGQRAAAAYLALPTIGAKPPEYDEITGIVHLF
jgi:hypothetical protein